MTIPQTLCEELANANIQLPDNLLTYIDAHATLESEYDAAVALYNATTPLLKADTLTPEELTEIETALDQPVPPAYEKELGKDKTMRQLLEGKKKRFFAKKIKEMNGIKNAFLYFAPAKSYPCTMYFYDALNLPLLHEYTGDWKASDTDTAERPDPQNAADLCQMEMMLVHQIMDFVQREQAAHALPLVAQISELL